MGRPSKIGKFLEKAKEVIENGHNAIILTDAELLIMINDKLDEEDQISETTWKNWKGTGDKEMKDERRDGFVSLYKKALIIQKRSLFIKLQEDDKAWQKYAWIIERKFDNWNLRIKKELTGKDGEDLFKLPEERKVEIADAIGEV